MVEEIKVTEQSAWWFGVSLISAHNSYKEVVWLARERRGEQLELLRKVTGEVKLKIFGMDRDEPSAG